MSAETFDKPFDYPLDTTRQPLPRGDTARSDIFAPLNKTQNDLQSELALDPTATSTTSKAPTEFSPTNPFAHPESATSGGLGSSTMSSSNFGGSQTNGSTVGNSSMSQKLTSKLEPASTIGSGAPTTRYHNFLYDTFTWKYPRTTGMLFAGSLATLLLSHYVNILRYAFKGAYISFAIAAAFEYLGRPTTGTGFMTQLRPQKYYTIPREQLENVFAEIHEFCNFIVLEFQRILFVENLGVTIGAFLGSYFCYFLIKFLPVWGLVLLADIGLFTIPLAYIQNQELIDHHVSRANSVVNEQLQTASALAQKHTADVTNKAKYMANDLSEKATNAYQSRRQSVPLNSQKLPVAGQDAPAAPPPPGPAPTLVEPVDHVDHVTPVAQPAY